MFIKSNDILDAVDPDSNFLQEFENSAQSKYYTLSDFSSQFSSSPGNMINILNYNIRSFGKNMDCFLPIIDNNRPQALVLSETWLKQSDTANIQDYAAYHTIRRGRRSGGVSVFVQNSFDSTDLPQFCYANSDIEICVVRMKVGNDDIFIIGIYRPHSGTIEGFTGELESVLRDPALKNQQCIIAGDFNVNLALSTPETTRFITCLQSILFLPVITKPTRFSPDNSSVPSILDQIWCNFLNVYNSGIVCYDVTDHCPTFVQIPTASFRANNETVKISFRLNNAENREKFSQSLLNFDWLSLVSDDINIYVENFLNVINDLYCKCFPMKTKQISKKKSLNPWFTPDLETLIRQKSTYFELFKIGAISKQENNIFKNKVKFTLTKAKSNYYNNLLTHNMNNARSTWKILNSLMNRSNNAGAIKSLIVNNVEFTEDEKIAEIFSEYFYKIPVELDDEIPETNTDPTNYISSNSLYPGLTMDNCTPLECSEIISKLKITKEEKDCVPVKLMVANRNVLAPIVSELINRSMTEGIFPETLKKASIIPIYKKNLKTSPASYRPISKLPFVSKIFEKVIFHRLSQYFFENNILSVHQFGFRKNISTLDAITHFTEIVYQALNEKKSLINILIDYSKAFDTVNIGILLRKLKKYGIDGVTLKLVHSYLIKRHQIVSIRNSKSSAKISSIGVPQGSVLGPLLFLVYVNEISNVSNQYIPTMFADDCTLSFQNSSLSSLIQECNSELSKFKSWSDSNRLTLNLEKTTCLFISNIHDSILQDSIKMGGRSIDIVKEAKFLGLIIDDKMKFNQHIDYICKKVSKSIGVLYKIRLSCPRVCLRTVYFSTIHPYFQYCLPIFAAAYHSHMEPLILLQKRAIRIVSGANYFDHTEPLFFNNRVLKISDLYKHSLGCFAYSNPEILSNFERTHSYGTRLRNSLLPPFERLRVSQQSVIYNAVKNWNEIPLNIKLCISKSSFKYQYRQFLLNQYQQTA